MLLLLSSLLHCYPLLLSDHLTSDFRCSAALLNSANKSQNCIEGGWRRERKEGRSITQQQQHIESLSTSWFSSLLFRRIKENRREAREKVPMDKKKKRRRIAYIRLTFRSSFFFFFTSGAQRIQFWCTAPPLSSSSIPFPSFLSFKFFLDSFLRTFLPSFLSFILVRPLFFIIAVSVVVFFCPSIFAVTAL